MTACATTCENLLLFTESGFPENCIITCLQAGLLLRNPLLEPRVWILDLVFGNFGGPFWPILAYSGASGPQKSILDVLTDLGTQSESSGACARPHFDHFREKCERFSKISDFKMKKSSLQSLCFSVSDPDLYKRNDSLAEQGAPLKDMRFKV